MLGKNIFNSRGLYNNLIGSGYLLLVSILSQWSHVGFLLQMSCDQLYIYIYMWFCLYITFILFSLIFLKNIYFMYFACMYDVYHMHVLYT